MDWLANSEPSIILSSVLLLSHWRDRRPQEVSNSTRERVRIKGEKGIKEMLPGVSYPVSRASSAETFKEHLLAAK